MNRGRPESVLWFERLFVASIFFSAVRAFLNWIENSSSGDFSLGGLSNLVIMQMLTTIISFSLDIGLWYFITRRASNVAKWILITKTSLGLAVMAWILPSLLRSNLETIVASALFIQMLIALSIIFLFRYDAQNWFREKGVLQEDSADLAERFR